MPPMPALSEFDVRSLETLFESRGFPRANAKRLLRRYYNSGGRSIDGVEVARELKASLLDEFGLRSTQLLARRQATDGTVKLLVGVGEGATQRGRDEATEGEEKTLPIFASSLNRSVARSLSSVECVLMPSHLADRAAGCVSSQVGCAMGCDFCASTKAGVERSLTAGEIVEQFLWLRAEALSQGRRLQTIVFMGMGEPLMNYDHVVAAVRRIAGEDLGAIGWRHVTLSTVGIVPGIDRLTEENLGTQLAVSLHAPDDDTRSAIVPTGKRYRVADILAAVARYQAASGRIATIEYTLLEGVNDSDAQADLLARLLNALRTDAKPGRESRMHVNLIPYNAIGPGLSGREYRQPSQPRMTRFLEILRDRGLVAHFRRTRGEDIEGACGQLRERVASGA
jgi:23S rRNA (adenine2503-C2)-methyltransferase